MSEKAKEQKKTEKEANKGRPGKEAKSSSPGSSTAAQGKKRGTAKTKAVIAKAEAAEKEKGMEGRDKKTRSPEKKQAEKIRRKIKLKKKPTFRGRFGKKWLRRKNKKKWMKWRKPRGIDIKRNAEDGAIPKSGYGTNSMIRFLHPSGLEERLVGSMQELKKINPLDCAARLRAGIGRRKRKIMLAVAKEAGIKVLNP